MKQKVLFVSHCILNTAAKVVMYDAAEMAAEEALRIRFVHAALDAGIQLVQLPCPEFSLYGCRRWGHTYEQFDNPFFRSHCRALLSPVMMELSEYLSAPDRFETLGFLGVDGSPSCGARYTCYGPWGGNLSGREDLMQTVSTVALGPGEGVFFSELRAMLSESGVQAAMEGLFAPEPERAMRLTVTGAPAE